MRSLLFASLFLSIAWPGISVEAKRKTKTVRKVVSTTTSTSWSTRQFLATTTTTSAVTTTSATTSQPAATSTTVQTGNNVPTATPQKSNTLPKYWTGANSYYLHTFAQTDRLAVLDQLKLAGFSTVRIFITYVYANNKGSNSIAMKDVEPTTVGVYDDTILQSIDQLMVECKARGLKLVIALHDRYALGWWSTDAYATTYGIVAKGSSGAQQVSDASVFYKSNTVMAMFDKRIRHIMQHKNALTGLTWAQSQDYIYAIEPQNEPMGHMALAYAGWTCDRASTIRSELPSGSKILVSTGGGITTQLSLASWAFTCNYFDIISVHDYGTTASTTAAALQAAQAKTDKIVIMGEWGMTGSNKAAIIAQFITAFRAAKLPWMYWEISNPGKGANDFEVWTNEASWQVLSSSATGGINPGAAYAGKINIGVGGNVTLPASNSSFYNNGTLALPTMTFKIDIPTGIPPKSPEYPAQAFVQTPIFPSASSAAVSTTPSIVAAAVVSSSAPAATAEAAVPATESVAATSTVAAPATTTTAAAAASSASGGESLAQALGIVGLTGDRVKRDVDDATNASDSSPLSKRGSLFVPAPKILVPSSSTLSRRHSPSADLEARAPSSLLSSALEQRHGRRWTAVHRRDNHDAALRFVKRGKRASARGLRVAGKA